MRVLTVAALTLASSPALAQTTIRDAETEDTIRLYAAPLFRAAGMNPDAIKVHLIEDSRLNAFVSGGLNMYLFTGLLIRAETPGQVIGVIAHETGHIQGGHLVRLEGRLNEARTEAMIAALLGVGAAVLAGDSRAGAGVALGGQSAALRNLLSYTRGEENAADQAAVRLLDGTGQSTEGLLDFMRILDTQRLLTAARQDPYLTTHPLTQDRIAFLEQHVATSPYTGTPQSQDLIRRHDRMRAKLAGFLEHPQKALRRFDADSDAVADRYGRAIALYHAGAHADSHSLLDGLIAEFPDDPYFREVKGQFLFETGQVADALPHYRDAVDRAPDQALIRIGHAQVMIALEERDQAPAGTLEQARDALREALSRDNTSALGWRLLGTAEGRLGDYGQAAYALAEYNLRTGDYAAAFSQAQKAERLLPAGSPAWLRIGDIKATAERRLQEEQDSNRRR